MKISLHSSRQPKSGGFALVIALSLMAFVLLLILTLTTFVRVETRSAQISLKQLQAKQAALLSVQLALGELQKYAGPDQRITARAEIMDTDPMTSTIEGVIHPYWTGVWDAETRRADYVTIGLYQPFPNPATIYQKKWLVSGNEGKDGVAMSFNENSPLNNANSVELVAETISGVADAVRAPLVPTDNGAYAWWIGDLGVSAKVGAREEASATYASELLVPRRSGVSALEEFAFARATPELVDDLDRLSSEQQLPLLDWVTKTSADVALDQKYAHDLTVNSYGVLADARSGGLKKDLTAGLQPNAAEPLGQIFDPIDSSKGLLDTGGPEWEQLRSFYNTRPDGGGLLQAQSMTDTQVGVHPVVTYWNLGYTMALIRPGGVAPSNFDEIGTDVSMRFHAHPIIVLWNPYNRPLAAQTYHWYLPAEDYSTGARVIFSDRELYNTSQARAATYVMSDPATNPHPLSIQLPKDNDAALNELFRATEARDHGSFKFAIECPELEPGQALVFSAEGYDVLEVQDQASYVGASSSDWNLLRPGWRNDTYFYQDVTVPDAIDPSTVVGDPSLIPVEDIMILPVTAYGNVGNALSSLLALSPESVTTDPLVFFDQQRIWASSASPSNNYEGDLLTGLNASFSLISVPRWKNGVSTSEVAIIDSGFSGRLAFDASVERNVYPSFGYQVQLVLSDSETLNSLELESMQFRWLANLNPRASVMGRTPFEKDSGRVGPVGYNGRFYRKNDSGDRGFMDSFGDVGFLGVSVFDASIEACVLYQIPGDESELSSIGSFMQADLARTGIDGAAGILGVPWNTSESQMNFVGNNVAPSYAIGNSFADPWVAPGRAYRRGVDWGLLLMTDHVHYDMSYMLNDQLWDGYFLSTIPHAPGAAPSIPYNASMQAIEGADLRQLRDDGLLFEQAAANLKVAGMFNVNSTSVMAWKVVLSSFLGVQPSGGNLPEEAAPFVRFLSDALLDQELIGANDLDSYFQGSYVRNRYLTVTEISLLAEAIVEQVKTRGPFFSMSEFVNRRLTDDGQDEARLSGALQAAIDTSAADINDGLSDTVILAGDIEPILSGNNYEYEHMEGARSQGISGCLTQADLLARFGAGLNVRSDTFVIRGYGEVRDPLTGDVTNSANCELVVQREAEFVDANSDSAWVSLDDLTSVNNQSFGRRFSIVSVRFLDGI